MRGSMRTSSRRQRGAAAVFAAVAMITMLIAMMLAIEVGRMYFAHRNLQKMANLAALDAARLMGGCNRSTPPTQAELEAQATDSIARNGGTPFVQTMALEPGRVTTALREGSGTEVVRYLDPVDPTDTAAMANASGVRVTLDGPFPNLLLPLLPQDDSAVMRVSATAEQAALGSFFLGSGLLSIDAGILNALLSGLLGGNVNLTAVDYNGLASASVSLAQLGTAVGLDAQDLTNPLALSTQTPVLSDVLDGLAGSLSGTASGTVTGLLGSLADSAAGNTNDIPLGDLFGSVTDVAANVPFVNLLDLILALGQASRADETGAVAPIALPIAASIPGVTTLQTFVQILEPPQFSGMKRPGSAEAETAQIRLLVRLQVDALSNITAALNLVLLGGVLGSIDAPPLNIGIDVDVAKARATLDQITCPSTTNPEPIAELSAEPSVATVTIGTYSGAAASAPALTSGSAQLLGVTINLLSLPGLQLANIPVSVTLAGPVSTNVGNGVLTPLPNPVTDFVRISGDDLPAGATKPFWLAEGVPPEPAVPNENPQTVGSTGLLSGAMSTLFASMNLSAASSPSGNICILRILGICTLSIPSGDIVNAVLDPVRTLLGSVLSGVGGIVDAVLDPLLRMLGIRIGSATVTMNTVSIDQPKLVSTALPAAPP